MPYGTLALDTISTSGNLAVTGNLTATGTLATAGNITSTGRIIEGTQECAQFANTSTYAMPNASTVIVPFNTAVIYQGITFNATSSTVNDIEGYHWQHSTTGVFKLTYQVRSATDTWNMISVCKNNSSSSPVGNSYRTGAVGGAWGLYHECLYRVSNISDRFCLFHWSIGTMGSMLAHAGGNPAGTFFVTPDSGTAPTTGYYNIITITRV